MRNILSTCLLILVLASCSMSINSIKEDDLKIPKKEFYTVTYSAIFTEGLTAKIDYTDENSIQVKLAKVSGTFDKTVSLKSGTHVQFNTLAKGNKGKGTYKVTVDGKTISEYTLKNKKLKYKIAFKLP